jgi:hypothetical protein
MRSVHHMVHQADRADGGVEWGCPRCGRYMVFYPLRHLVLLLGEAGTVHLPGKPFPPVPAGAMVQSEFDRRWLPAHGMAW